MVKSSAHLNFLFPDFDDIFSALFSVVAVFIPLNNTVLLFYNNFNRTILSDSKCFNANECAFNSTMAVSIATR